LGNAQAFLAGFLEAAKKYKNFQAASNPKDSGEMAGLPKMS
jgi:hypothetical protein